MTTEQQAPTRDEWRERLASHSEWENVPHHTRQAMLDHLTGRYSPFPGSWFYAVLTNDLKGAVIRADIRNRAALVPIVGMLYDKFPSASWGSAERVREWDR